MEPGVTVASFRTTHQRFIPFEMEYLNGSQQIEIWKGSERIWSTILHPLEV